MLQVDGTPPPPRLDAPRGSAAAAPAAASPSFEAASTRHARVAFGGPTLRLHRAPRMEMPPAPRPLTMKRYAAAARIARVRGARAWPPGCPHTCIPARVLGVRWQLHGALGGCSGGRQVASEAGCLGGHSGAAPREAQEHEQRTASGLPRAHVTKHIRAARNARDVTRRRCNSEGTHDGCVGDGVCVCVRAARSAAGGRAGPSVGRRAPGRAPRTRTDRDEREHKKGLCAGERGAGCALLPFTVKCSGCAEWVRRRRMARTGLRCVRGASAPEKSRQSAALFARACPSDVAACCEGRVRVCAPSRVRVN